MANAAAAMVDEARLRSLVERLAASPRHSGEDPAAHRAAMDMIAAEMTAAQCSVERQEFEIPSQEPPRMGLNVIGRLEANEGAAAERPAVLVGAHYDTVPGSPGADDNASGVAVMLECARVLSALPRFVPMVFAAFDAEERQPPVEGLHGSTAYVQGLRAAGPPQRQVSAAFILEMVGYSAPPGGQGFPRGFQLLFPRAFDMLREAAFAGDSVVAVANARSREVGRRLERAAAAWGGGLKVLPMELPGWMGVPRNLRRSDHAPFWQTGIPAVMVGDTANFRNPDYHLPGDTTATLDYGLLMRVARAMAGMLASTVA